MAAPRSDNKKRFKRNEIILLSIFGALWALGLILGILGLIAYNLPSLIKNNPLYSAQTGFASFLGIKGVIDFRILGTAILLIATVFILIVLRFYANKYDSIRSKQERRKQLVQEFLSTDGQTSTNQSPATESKKSE